VLCVASAGTGVLLRLIRKHDRIRTAPGKTAKYMPIDKAADHIFGYTIQIDVSDRGGRSNRK
ncbi:MAG: hypothetical protein QM736_14175, partial [Vicinamibacterales bacterium]